MDIELPNGTVIQGVPEGTTKQQVMEKAIKAGLATAQDFGTAPSSAMSSTDVNTGNINSGFAMGLKDPISGGAQLLPRGLEAVTSLGGLAPNPVSQFFGSEAQRVDQMVKAEQEKYAQQRVASGAEGFDVGRIAGNVINPANNTTVYIEIGGTKCNSRSGVACTSYNDSDNIFLGYAQFHKDSSGNWSYELAPPDDTSTRIDAVVPIDNSSVATSTPFDIGADGYVNEDDWKDGDILRIFIRNDAQNASQLVGPLFADMQETWVSETFEFDIEASGAFSTTTSFQTSQIGVYSMTTEILRPRFSILGWNMFYETLVSTSTDFLVATSTQFDVMKENIDEELDAIMGDVSINCTIDWTTAFCLADLGDCAKFLFVYSTDAVFGKVKDMAIAFIHRAPWGYATRAIDIVFDDSVASSTLPSIAITLPSSLPHGGETIDFTPYTHIQNALTRIDTTEVETIDGSPLEEFIFWWETLWKIVFVLWLLREIHGAWESGDFEDVGFVGGDAHGRMRKDIHGRTYQEWSTGDIKRAINKGRNSDTFKDFGKMKGKSSNRHRY